MISQLNVNEMSIDELFKLFRVYKTLNKMMKDRGYTLSGKGSIPSSYEDWEKDIRENNKMSGIFTKIVIENDENEQYSQNEENDKKENKKKVNLFFHYIPNDKINKETIQHFVKEMQTTEASSGIIITSSTKLSEQAKKQIGNSKELTIEIFNLNELVVNITEHELVPNHTLLSKKDKKLLLERYKIKDSQLPKILVSDPIARYLGLKRGDVVKITRKSETAGRYITYRIAI